MLCNCKCIDFPIFIVCAYENGTANGSNNDIITSTPYVNCKEVKILFYLYRRHRIWCMLQLICRWIRMTRCKNCCSTMQKCQSKITMHERRTSKNFHMCVRIETCVTELKEKPHKHWYRWAVLPGEQKKRRRRKYVFSRQQQRQRHQQWQE